jgi:thermitase
MSPTAHTRPTARTRPPAARVVGAIAVVLAVVVPLSGTTPLAAAPSTLPPPTAETEVVRLVVDDPAAGVAAAADPDVDLVRLTPEFAVVETTPDDEATARGLAEAAGADVVERDVPVRLAYTPTDPGWGAWWGALQMGLNRAWNTTLGDADVDIAVIDTGVNPVVELSGKLLGGWAVPGSSPTVDTNGHGTSSAMVAAGLVNNGTGASGACPLCDIIPINVFAPGASTAFMSDVASGITWATNNGAEIINISLAGSGTTTALNNAVTYAEANGVIVVAAAGNEGTTVPQYPAALSTVLGVAATTNTLALTSYSNRGSHISVAGAGTNIVAGTAFGSWTSFSGTSSASPLVAGTIGLLEALAPGMSAADVRYYVRVASPQPPAPLQVAWGALSAPALVSLAEPGWPPAPFSDVRRPSWYDTAVDWAYQAGITEGVGPWAFGPESTVTRAQAFTMLWRYAGEPVPTIPNPFSDVPPTAYYATAATWAYEEGITTGVGGSDRFEGTNPLSRAQAVTILWRYDGEPVPTIPNPFVDVPPGAYYATAATWAYEEGITTGVGGTAYFEGERPVSRAENVTFLWRFAGSPPGP